MKKLLLAFLLISYISTSQENITFNDGQIVNLEELNQQLIDVVGESNIYFTKSSIEQFTFCFFNNIAKQSSYTTYQQDLTKSINHSENKDKRMIFLYSIKYVNSALWKCFGEVPEFLKEYSKVDKIIPQSDIEIKAFAKEHLNDMQKELGMSDYIEKGKIIDWESYADCLVRKLWLTFTPKEMFENSFQFQEKVESFQSDCFAENLIAQEINIKYDSNFITDESLLKDYISFVNYPKSKGLNFKIKSPIGFINTLANSPNIIQLWRKENASRGDDPWIYLLILNEGIPLAGQQEFKKDLIDGGATDIANAVNQNSSNVYYFSVGNYSGVMFDAETNGQLQTIISLFLENHTVQFFYSNRGITDKDEDNKLRDIFIAFAKSFKII